jgi:hypothetical protein
MEWNGREFISTFPSDFAIANSFGETAVRDTYKRAFNEWKTDYKMLTDLVITLNWYIWIFHEKDDVLAKTYNELWMEADNYALKNLKGEALSYFYRETD